MVLRRGKLGLITVIAAGALALAAFLMAVATPTTLGPIGVTAWFVLILFGVSGVFALVAYGVSRFIQPKRSIDQRNSDSIRRGLLIGGFVTVLVALTSLKQFSPRDAALMLLLVVLVEFYTVARS